MLISKYLWFFFFQCPGSSISILLVKLFAKIDTLNYQSREISKLPRSREIDFHNLARSRPILNLARLHSLILMYVQNKNPVYIIYKTYQDEIYTRF